MKLVIISDMAHYRRAGEVVGWGPTVQEIDHLARLFDEVVHVCALHETVAPESALSYRAPNLRVRLVPAAGGARLLDKLHILRLCPRYYRVIREELAYADVVHVRSPANIALLALAVLTFRRSPRIRWVKYAGSWTPYVGEPLTYRLQRKWLRMGAVRAEVTVNGQWPSQRAHIHTFLNPCLNENELREGARLAREKELGAPIRLLFVGQLAKAKGPEQLLHIAARLRDQARPVEVVLVGDGPEREVLEQMAQALGVADLVCFAGWVPRTELGSYYRVAHVLVLPSKAEGWPKVLSEAMAYGAVPVASAVGSIPQVLEACGTGRSIAPDDLGGFVEAVAWYADHSQDWKREVVRGVEAAERFSYAHYRAEVRRLLLTEA